MDTDPLTCPECGCPADSAELGGETVARCGECGFGSAVASNGDAIPDDELGWGGQRDDHTGVSVAGGIPYTYEHVDGRPDSDDGLYRVTTVIDFASRPVHRNRYYVPASLLDAYLCPSRGEIAEEIVDIRPVSLETAQAEMDGYRADGGDRIVAEFRHRQPDDPSTLGGHGPEVGPNETTATCWVCGYFGVVDDDWEITNAAHPETDTHLVCHVCDAEGGD